MQKPLTTPQHVLHLSINNIAPTLFVRTYA